MTNKRYTKGLPLPLSLHVLLSGPELIASALRTNWRRGHSKDSLTLPSDPQHSLKALILFAVTGFCETPVCSEGTLLG